MGKEYVPVFFDWLETTQDLTAEEKGNLIDAVVAYAAGKEYEHLLTGGCRIAFRFLKGQVDRNTAISDVRRQAREGKRQQDTTEDNKEEQNETNDNKPQQNESNSPKEKEKENNNNNKKRVFIPPTLEEVTEYCKERNNGIDPQYFMDYQTARNWTLSNGKKMADWRATIRTWERNDFNRNKAAQNPAQDYHQRDYKDAQEDAFERMMALGG